MADFLLLCLTLLITTFQHCTSDSVRQYYFSATARTWDEARLFCNTSYNGLATIITKNDFSNAIYEIPTMVGHPLTHIWIGLNDRDSEKKWIWDDGTECIFNTTKGGHDCSDFWLATQPDNEQDEDCGELWLEEGSFAINDISCDYVQPVLCNNPLNKEYIFDGTFRNFSEAEKFCSINHGGLATIQTTQEYIKAVQAIPSGVTQALIGLNDLKNHSYWTWSNGDLCNKDDTANMTLEHDCSPFWAPGEPFNYNYSGHGAHCGQLKYLYSGTWLIKDVPCDRPLSVLCIQTVTAHPTLQPLPDIQNDRYAFTRTARTWAESLVYCEENYIGLATILNMNDLNSAIDVIPANFDALNIGHPWIGISDIKKEGIWQWEDGTLCEWMNGTLTNNIKCSNLWHNGQPDDWRTNEDCGGLWFHNNIWRFNDAACDQVKTAICLKNITISITTLKPSKKPSINPTQQNILPTERTTSTIGMNTTQQNNIDCNTVSSNKTSSGSMLIVLIIIIVILIILLILTTYNMCKYKKIIQSTMSKSIFSDDKQNDGGNQMTEAMDVKLVTNDQFQTVIN